MPDDTIPFTGETRDGRKTCLEWEVNFLGEDVSGATIVTRNEAGLIDSIRLYHRPLRMVILVSAELTRRLGIPG